MTIDKNRCVVTGLGMISAIGNTVNECWDSVISSRSGIAHTKTVDTNNCYADYAAEVKDNTLDNLPNASEMDRATKLCVKATDEALKDAGLNFFNGDSRVSVIMGSCVGGVVSIEHYYTQGKDKSDILKMPISNLANHVAGYCQAGGVVTNVANACAAGTISIAYASDLIRAGKADVVIAGGADAFASVPYSGFIALHALDDEPCSPFNHSKGITLGEGAGAVIIESYEHAKKRGAKVYCEVLGSGISSDAHHITAPRPDGEGQMNAIKNAIKYSGVAPSEIEYVNAHGTGTAKNDQAEFLSLHTLFDETNDNLSVSSTKSMTGHCLGAAGAIEAVLSIKALTENVLPPTIGYSEQDLEVLAEKAGKIDFCPNTAKPKNLTTVMSNSFAFGGNNASIIFSKEKGNISLPEQKPEILVTGLGIVSPLGNGVENYVNKFNAGEKIESGNVKSTVSSADYEPLGLKMAFYRKLDNFSQLQAVSGMYALKDGDFQITDENATDIGIIVGSSEGALAPGCDFEMGIAEKGNATGSAFKFPNTVYNAAGGYLSICSGIKGYNVTITNGTQSGLQSIAYAVNVIREGKEKAMLATGSDENNDIITELYEGLNLVADSVKKPYENGDKFSLSDGSTSILIETKNSAKERGAKVYARIAGYGMAHKNVKFGSISGSGDGLYTAIMNAFEDASMSAKDIDAVIGFANGHKSVDDIELKVYSKVFEGVENKPSIISIKERMGEGRAATAALSVAHASLLLSGEIEKDENAYNVTANGIEKAVVNGKALRNVLAITYGSGGSYSAIIVSKED